MVAGVELSQCGNDPGSVWSGYEPYEWLAGCARSRRTDPTQAEVEGSMSGRRGWSLDQWQGDHGSVDLGDGELLSIAEIDREAAAST